MDIKKIDDFTIEVKGDDVVSTPPPITYTKEYLISQRINIKAQLEAQTAERQAELDYIDLLLSECEKQGVKTQTELEEEKIALKEETPNEETPNPNEDNINDI
jgi:hypothetical protein